MSEHSGILVPFAGLQVDTDNTTAIDDGRHVGRAVASDVSGAMGLRSKRRDRATAAVSDDVGGVVVQAQRGGLPTPAHTAGPATFLWRYDDETDAALRGWDAPNTGPTRYTSTIYETTFGAIDETDAVPFNEQTVVAYRTNATGDHRIRAAFIERDGTRTSTTIDGPDSHVRHPCIVVVRNEVHVYWWARHSWDDGAFQTLGWSIRGARWDESASSWVSLGWVTPLDDNIKADGTGGTTTPDRLSAAAVDDVVVLVAMVYDTARTNDEFPLYQWRSTDGGRSFLALGIQTEDDGTEGVVRADVVADGRSFVVVYGDAADNRLKAARLGVRQSVADVFAQAVDVFDADLVSLSVGGNADAGDHHHAIGVAQDGTLWIWCRMYQASDPGYAYRLASSADGGATWSVWPAFFGLTPYDAGGSDCVEVLWPSVLDIDGSLRILCCLEATNAANDEFIVGTIELGGPSTDAFAAELSSYALTLLLSWIAIRDLGNEPNWSAADTGAGTVGESLSQGYFTLDASGAAAARTWTRTLSDVDVANDEEGGILIRAMVQATGSGTPYPAQIDAEFDGYGVQITIDEAEVRVLGSTVGAYTLRHTESITTSAWVEVLVGMANGRARVAVREHTDRAGVWRRIDAFDIDDNGNSTQTIVITSNVDTGFARLVTWRFLAVWQPGAFDDIREPVARWVDINAADVPGRPFSLFPVNLDLDFAVVATGDGVCAEGDTWTIPIARTYDLSRTIDPDPRRGWRELAPSSTPSTRTIAWSWDHAYPVSDVIGIALIDTTIVEYDLDLYVPGTGWVSYGTIDTSAVAGLAFTDEASSSAILDTDEIVHPREFVPGWFVSGVGSGTDAAQRLQRAVQDHSGAVKDTRGLVVHIDGTIGDTDAGSPAIYPASHVVLVSLRGQSVTKARITLPAGTDDETPEPPDDRHQLGAVVIGPFVPFSERYAWGRVLETRHNVETTTSRGGSRRSVRRGPPRRRVELAWSDGVDAYQAVEGDGAPDVVNMDTGTGAHAVAHRSSVLQDLDATLQRVDGPGSPVVYVAAAEGWTAEDTTPVRVLTRRHRFVYGRLPDRVRVDTVQGDELEGEVGRISRIAIDEEV